MLPAFLPSLPGTGRRTDLRVKLPPGVVESAAGRYVVELAGWYVVCDHTRRNPAGLLCLLNDAGAEHANVRCLSSGKMEATRDIAVGEELYWCYGDRGEVPLGYFLR